ncbi:mannitol dehydrogenase family protein [Roseobacter sp. YSTF-M11]|uniref:Mannitol dehydrogenase family protein n=1 Tax=Roseobacter insulae TaxID=2859783 RepID=A0A9X1FRK3_9RHOB|nr:mannitol dehydrogenase family protein [Roseobacter insulae]MBW4706491.1 mannitol dehydrogenase family protein [Roseobacter insulae]
MPRILHIGVGNFCRAHLADYTQDAGGWSVTGVSLRSAAVRDGLAAQGFDYTLAIQGEGTKRITVFDDILVAPEDPAAVLVQIVAEDVHIISVTVTEKGYHLGADNRLDTSDPLIAGDLSGRGPRTVIGLLAHGLARRRAPVTVLSCDNRNDNGDTLRNAVQEFAARAALPLDTSRVTFPNSMVDRITPATTDTLRQVTGDKMAVPTEPFREWVIEDSFAGPRPEWRDVQFVTDVAPHEMRKLRMLNAAHSMLAYAGILAGYDYVHEAVGDSRLRAEARALMAEAAQTLAPEVQAKALAYAEALIARFDNPHINHSLRQIAMDGSQKLPYRMFESLRALHADDITAPALGRGVRAWLAFCRAETAANRAVQDPLGPEIARVIAAGGPDADILALIDAADLAAVIQE